VGVCGWVCVGGGGGGGWRGCARKHMGPGIEKRRRNALGVCVCGCGVVFGKRGIATQCA
jgi:hypothetical protein